MKLQDIMNTEVVTIGMDDRLKTVQALFERHHFHHLPVVNEDKRVMGVISDRDLLKALSPFISTLMERRQDVATLDKRIHHFMSRRLIVASRHHTVDQATAMILNNNVSCLPIVRSDRIIEGIVTLKDILMCLVKQHNEQILKGDSMSHLQEERRKLKRVSYICEVECEGQGPITRMTNLSIKGAYLKTPNPFPKDAMVKLYFRMGAMDIETDATVIHSTPGIGMGVLFSNLSPQYRAMIEKVVEE